MRGKENQSRKSPPSGGEPAPRARPAIVTTSWDDGDARDRRLADLLLNRAMRGTFYCPVEAFDKGPALTRAQQREMVAQGLEIGAHGIAHEIMPQVAPEKLDGILSACKAYLEDVVGQRVPMFCYPRGRYTPAVVRAVSRAGYQGARTIRLFATHAGTDLLQMPTSMQACPHTRVQYFRNMARARSPQRMLDYTFRLRLEGDWLSLGKRLFDRVLDEGGVWHLWGHSWEIDELGLWPQLAELFDYVAGRKEVLYLNNGGLVASLAAGRDATA